MTDTNDNPPVFNEVAYSFDIPENAPRGYQVGMIIATDPDLGANSQLSYTVISDWANDVFSLNPQTGVFTLTAKLDYEEVSDNCWFHTKNSISFVVGGGSELKIKLVFTLLFHQMGNKVSDHYTYTR